MKHCSSGVVNRITEIEKGQQPGRPAAALGVDIVKILL